MLPLFRPADAAGRLTAILARTAVFSADIDARVAEILEDVRCRGDAAVYEASERFDGVRPAALRVSQTALDAALGAMDDGLRRVIEEAIANVRRFHEGQKERSWFTDDADGTILGQRIVPMERVGLYVPGGTAFYPSSMVMNAVPAQVAGVGEILVVSPPRRDTGAPHVLVLATARLLGLTHVYAVGGAQAIAALAHGTATIPAVDKITGPGNAFVASAKRQVFGRVAIDAIAGPSEIVVLADGAAAPAHIAADLLAQAEHDERASAILVTPSMPLAEAVRAEAVRLAATLPRRAILEKSLADYGAIVVTDTMDEAVEIVNRLAPEHLEVLTHSPWDVLPRIRHAGAIFLGDASPEPVGDYFAGPNHVLPTGGTARYASALGVHDFVRRQSVVAYSDVALQRHGDKIARFARAEGLDAHALSIQMRLEGK